MRYILQRLQHTQLPVKLDRIQPASVHKAHPEAPPPHTDQPVYKQKPLISRKIRFRNIIGYKGLFFNNKLYCFNQAVLTSLQFSHQVREENNKRRFKLINYYQLKLHAIASKNILTNTT